MSSLEMTGASAPDDVYVWHACLDVVPAAVRALEASLSDDERARAERFRFERDRRRFVAARGVLRAILGTWLGLEPGRLHFHYGERGKPLLSREFGGDNLFFNVAHSQGHGVFAVVPDAEVGVDIEVIRPVPDALAIAERFFSPAECKRIQALPASLRQVAFFHCWTRKEAYIKGLGEGLSHPLDRFGVTVAPGQPARLLQTAEEPDEMSLWSLHDLSQIPTYASAVAVKRQHVRLHVGQWELGVDPST